MSKRDKFNHFFDMGLCLFLMITASFPSKNILGVLISAILFCMWTGCLIKDYRKYIEHKTQININIADRYVPVEIKTIELNLWK